MARELVTRPADLTLPVPERPNGFLAVEENDDGDFVLATYDPDTADPDTCCFKYARYCNGEDEGEISQYRRLVGDIDYSKRYTVTVGVTTVYLYFDADDPAYVGRCSDAMTETTDPCPVVVESCCENLTITISGATLDLDGNDVSAVNGTWPAGYQDANVHIYIDVNNPLSACFTVRATTTTGGVAFSNPCGQPFTGDVCPARGVSSCQAQYGDINDPRCPCAEDCNTYTAEDPATGTATVECAEEEDPP